MRRNIVIAVLSSIIVLGAGAWTIKNTFSNRTERERAEQKVQEAAIVAQKDTPTTKKPPEDNATDNNTPADDISNNPPFATEGSYSDYSESKLSVADSNKVVLFFHAPWCPECREADKNFSTNTIPANLTLLKTDYDSSTALRKKYGVTYQHTFVQVDSKGNLLKKWSGTTSYAKILEQTI